MFFSVERRLTLIRKFSKHTVFSETKRRWQREKKAEASLCGEKSADKTGWLGSPWQNAF